MLQARHHRLLQSLNEMGGGGGGGGGGESDIRYIPA